MREATDWTDPEENEEETEAAAAVACAQRGVTHATKGVREGKLTSWPMVSAESKDFSVLIRF